MQENKPRYRIEYLNLCQIHLIYWKAHSKSINNKVSYSYFRYLYDVKFSSLTDVGTKIYQFIYKIN